MPPFCNEDGGADDDDDTYRQPKLLQACDHVAPPLRPDPTGTKIKHPLVMKST